MRIWFVKAKSWFFASIAQESTSGLKAKAKRKAKRQAAQNDAEDAQHSHLKFMMSFVGKRGNRYLGENP